MGIIKEKLTALQFNELEDFLQTVVLRESFATWAEDKIEYLATVEMDDYFLPEYPEFETDDGEYLGKGIDTISNKYILNDETRDDIVRAFNMARDAAYEEWKEERESD